MFVLLKGATKEQSFKIGQEIAEAVTATNPKPVKLKFEKVRERSVNGHTGLAWFSVFLTPSPSSPGSRNVWNVKGCRCMCSLSWQSCMCTPVCLCIGVFPVCVSG